METETYKLTIEQMNSLTASVERDYSHYIENRLKNVNEYLNKPIELKDFKDFFIESVINGIEYKREYYVVLREYDNYQFEKENRINSLIDFVEDESTTTLIDFLKKGDEIFNIDYYESDYLLEHLTEIFELKNLFDKVNGFNLFTESRGDLFINRASFDSVLDNYSLDDLQDEDFTLDLSYSDIDLILSIYLFDNYRDSLVIKFDYENYKKTLEVAKEKIQEELVKRQNDLIISLCNVEIELKTLNNYFNKEKVETSIKLLQIEIKHIRDEINSIEKALHIERD